MNFKPSRKTLLAASALALSTTVILSACTGSTDSQQVTESTSVETSLAPEPTMEAPSPVASASQETEVVAEEELSELSIECLATEAFPVKLQKKC